MASDELPILATPREVKEAVEGVWVRWTVELVD